MEKKTNLKKYAVFSLSFILFAFTLPGNSFSPLRESGNPATTIQEVEGQAVPVQLADLAADESAVEIFDEYLEDTFDEMDLRGTGMKLSVFKRAVIGFHNLKKQRKASAFKNIITIVDFSKASRYKRLWTLDLKTKKILFHTYVAHGQGSGADKAYAFSDEPNSHQSSLGFYVTANTYYGKHGLSLKLNGQDTGFNKNALERAIVVHGADYVSKDFIKQHGRLGRSHGCPAVPEELTTPIINTIKEQTVLYIDGGIESYSSTYLNRNLAAAYFVNENQTLKASL